MTVCQSTDGAGGKISAGQRCGRVTCEERTSEQTLGIKSQGAGECISFLGRRNSSAKALS